VIALGNGVQVLVATKPVDFRKGADGLAALVQESLSADPFCGAIYVFRAKRANRVVGHRRHYADAAHQQEGGSASPLSDNLMSDQKVAHGLRNVVRVTFAAIRPAGGNACGLCKRCGKDDFRTRRAQSG
jgi:hypothetical protein